ncbi:hypothetical protein [Nocardia wallacei]|uniref:hypothetical protein n=1 Tax=Nocardia wallacei TaxID=480035 RepID=UPI002457A14F|nr:hypothetical protein [Nocardia wallacei]
MTTEAKHAKLPAEHRRPTIGDMEVGDAGWAVPWALFVDGEDRLWLKPVHTLEPEPWGTATMRVECQEDGLHVSVADGERVSEGHVSEGSMPVAAFGTLKKPGGTP